MVHRLIQLAHGASGGGLFPGINNSVRNHYFPAKLLQRFCFAPPLRPLHPKIEKLAVGPGERREHRPGVRRCGDRGRLLASPELSGILVASGLGFDVSRYGDNVHRRTGAVGPLFYKVRPLEDSELKTRLEQLAKKAVAKVNGIFTPDFSSKGTTANAALMGIGRTRRIVISDTSIKQYSTPEIEVVTAHEIGHHLHRDILRSFVVQSALYLILLRIVDAILLAVVFPLGYNEIADPGFCRCSCFFSDFSVS